MLEHLGLLEEAGQALDNGNIQVLNRVANAFGVEVGKSAKTTYDLIAKNATSLRELSEDARWKVSPDTHYFRLGADFQMIADELAEKARQKNLDGATLAYLELTMSCVKCHKLVRDKRLVSATDPMNGSLSSQADFRRGTR